MFLRSLKLIDYGIFKNAVFDFSTTVDQPIVLITGNNGAGKTSILEGLRIALHGRRAFDIPLGEAEYIRAMAGRFHSGGDKKRAEIALDFDYVDNHVTRRITISRSWHQRRQNVTEELVVTLDGAQLDVEDAEDLLGSIVPPEIARYFFFDGERIRELAEWDAEDESALFAAVGDLLGLGVIDQLRNDLVRLSSVEKRTSRAVRDVSTLLSKTEEDERLAVAELKRTKANSRKIRVAFDRARFEVRRVGAMRQDEIAELENELGTLTGEKQSLLEEATRAATDVLPLLCAKTLRSRFGKEIEIRRDIEDRAVVSKFIADHASEITVVITKSGLRNVQAAKEAVKTIATIACGKPRSVSDVTLPSLSRNEAVWMQRVIESELPDMAKRNDEILNRLRVLENRISALEDRRRSIPVDDSAAENALKNLESRQREFIEHESLLLSIEANLKRIREEIETLQSQSKGQRLERFKAGKQQVREQSVAAVLELLPILTNRLQTSKEVRFAKYLESALHELWHKTERLVGVEVSFSKRRIALLDAFGEINKRDLSAGEKQLFAVAFIYALARLSGRHMPFVIDTPLGRLDMEHRRRLVADFIPSASHQIILLSTDTEIVGSLYEDIRPLLAHHHELSDFNGRATDPVQVSA